MMKRPLTTINVTTKQYNRVWKLLPAALLLAIIALPVFALRQSGEVQTSGFASARKRRQDDVIVYTPIVIGCAPQKLNYNPDSINVVDITFGLIDTGHIRVPAITSETPRPKWHKGNAETRQAAAAARTQFRAQGRTIIKDTEGLTSYVMPPMSTPDQLEIPDPKSNDLGAVVSLLVMHENPYTHQMEVISPDTYLIIGTNGVQNGASTGVLSLYFLPGASEYFPSGVTNIELHLVRVNGDKSQTEAVQILPVFRN